MNSRDRILTTLRANTPNLNASPRPASYRPVTQCAADELLSRFTAEVERLTGKVYPVPSAQAAIDQILALIGDDRRVLTGDNLPLPELARALQEHGVEPVTANIRGEAHPQLSTLEPIRIGLTGAVAGLASTGTIVLSTAQTGARFVSLLPQIHIALLPKARLYPTPEAWIAAGGKNAIQEASSVFFITGPSRTSDIEMQTILGVHGPGQIHIFILP